MIGKLFQGETNVAKPFGQTLEHIVELATPGDRMRSNHLIIAATDLFVEIDVRRAA